MSSELDDISMSTAVTCNADRTAMAISSRNYIFILLPNFDESDSVASATRREVIDISDIVFRKSNDTTDRQLRSLAFSQKRHVLVSSTMDNEKVVEFAWSRELSSDFVKHPSGYSMGKYGLLAVLFRDGTFSVYMRTVPKGRISSGYYYEPHGFSELHTSTSQLAHWVPVFTSNQREKLFSEVGFVSHLCWSGVHQDPPHLLLSNDDGITSLSITFTSDFLSSPSLELSGRHPPPPSTQYVADAGEKPSKSEDPDEGEPSSTQSSHRRRRLYQFSGGCCALRLRPALQWSHTELFQLSREINSQETNTIQSERQSDSQRGYYRLSRLVHLASFGPSRLLQLLAFGSVDGFVGLILLRFDSMRDKFIKESEFFLTHTGAPIQVWPEASLSESEKISMEMKQRRRRICESRFSHAPVTDITFQPLITLPHSLLTPSVSSDTGQVSESSNNSSKENQEVLNDWTPTCSFVGTLAVSQGTTLVCSLLNISLWHSKSLKDASKAENVQLLTPTLVSEFSKHCEENYPLPRGSAWAPRRTALAASCVPVGVFSEEGLASLVCFMHSSLALTGVHSSNISSIQPVFSLLEKVIDNHSMEEGCSEWKEAVGTSEILSKPSFSIHCSIDLFTSSLDGSVRQWRMAGLLGASLLLVLPLQRQLSLFSNLLHAPIEKAVPSVDEKGGLFSSPAFKMSIDGTILQSLLSPTVMSEIQQPGMRPPQPQGTLLSPHPQVPNPLSLNEDLRTSVPFAALPAPGGTHLMLIIVKERLRVHKIYGMRFFSGFSCFVSLLPPPTATDLLSLSFSVASPSSPRPMPLTDLNAEVGRHENETYTSEIAKLQQLEVLKPFPRSAAEILSILLALLRLPSKGVSSFTSSVPFPISSLIRMPEGQSKTKGRKEDSVVYSKSTLLDEGVMGFMYASSMRAVSHGLGLTLRLLAERADVLLRSFLRAHAHAHSAHNLSTPTNKGLKTPSYIPVSVLALLNPLLDPLNALQLPVIEVRARAMLSLLTADVHVPVHTQLALIPFLLSLCVLAELRTLPLPSSLSFCQGQMNEDNVSKASKGKAEKLTTDELNDQRNRVNSLLEVLIPAEATLWSLLRVLTHIVSRSASRTVSPNGYVDFSKSYSYSSERNEMVNEGGSSTLLPLLPLLQCVVGTHGLVQFPLLGPDAASPPLTVNSALLVIPLLALHARALSVCVRAIQLQFSSKNNGDIKNNKLKNSTIPSSLAAELRALCNLRARLSPGIEITSPDTPSHTIDEQQIGMPLLLPEIRALCMQILECIDEKNAASVACCDVCGEQRVLQPRNTFRCFRISFDLHLPPFSTQQDNRSMSQLPVFCPWYESCLPCPLYVRDVLRFAECPALVVGSSSTPWMCSKGHPLSAP